jgi:hypothetical protein
VNTYWWFRPSRIALLATMPIACYAYFASNQFYEQFGDFNAITTDRFFLVWMSIMAFAAASWLGEVVVPAVKPPPPARIRESNFQVLLFSLALVAGAATLIFLAPFVSHPALVMAVLRGDPGASDTVREIVDKIPGVTSQENLFSVVIVLFMIKPKLTGRPRTATEKAVIALVLALTAVKVVLHTERLALIELMVPLFLLAVAMRRSRSIAFALMPVAGVGALFLYFTGTEYLRSWVSWYSSRSDSLLDFALYRMLGYYMTAVNNGAYVYGEIHGYYFPLFTATWLWRLPIPGLPDLLTSISGTKIDYMQLLSGLNVEFNNPSGLFSVLIDFGPLLGVLIWGLLGAISGRLYRAFVDGRYIGLVLFPTWYVGVLEMPRIFYWGDARYFPPLIISCVIVVIFASAVPAAMQRRSFRAPPRPLPGGLPQAAPQSWPNAR